MRHDRTLEQIVFPIPEICEYLTTDTKMKIFHTAERDDQGSKVADFFDKAEEMFNEMKWQKKLRGELRNWKLENWQISNRFRMRMKIKKKIEINIKVNEHFITHDLINVGVK